MKIEQYISQLLYRYQCVTVPGFGAFLTETQSAQVNESSNAFYPPKKLVSFNAQLKSNDGLLANHISKAERISYETAVDAIQDEVSIWRNILEINEKFTLKNIGELSLNTERKVVFSPYQQLNYLTDSFGLNSFVSPGITREELKQQAEVFQEKVPVAFTDEKRNSRAWLKYAAVFLLAVSAAGTIGYRAYQSQLEQEAVAVRSEVQKEIQDKIQEATFFIENPLPAVTLTVVEDKMPYHVVAGAFRKESNAQNAFEELSKMGYKARRLDANSHGLFPVLYGSYPSYREAYRAMINVKREHNPDAWLLIKELK